MLRAVAGNRDPIRFMTWLAPGIPLTLYQALAQHVGARLGLPVSVASETRTSGPIEGEVDPFSAGEADVGFLCAPPFLELCHRVHAPVELLPAAPVFRDPRTMGRPIYFSDVIVRRSSPTQSFDDLEGGTWCYNDPCSLSGYHSLFSRLARNGGAHAFFRRVLHSGSHFESMRMVAEGGADAAAIDSNVLRLRLATDRALADHLRVVETWGPHPIQPIAVHRALSPDLKQRLAAAFLDLGSDPESRRALDAHDIERFVPVSEEHYQGERQALLRREAGVVVGAGARGAT